MFARHSISIWIFEMIAPLRPGSGRDIIGCQPLKVSVKLNRILDPLGRIDSRHPGVQVSMRVMVSFALTHQRLHGIFQSSVMDQLFG